MMGELSASSFDERQPSPDFVVHLQVDENTTARLFAYRDVGSVVSGAGGFVAVGDEGRRTPVQSVGVGVGLGVLLNASIHNVDFNPLLVPSTIQENDSKGF